MLLKPLARIAEPVTSFRVPRPAESGCLCQLSALIYIDVARRSSGFSRNPCMECRVAKPVLASSHSKVTVKRRGVNWCHDS